jgi:hypothetical protein
MFQHFGIETETIERAPDSHLPRIREFALEILIRIRDRYPSAELVLNATGGNKLMMLGFVEVFRDEHSVCYADTQNGCIETLAKNGAAVTSERMTQVLDVRDYLLAHGFVFEAARSDAKTDLIDVQRRKEAAKYLGTNVKALGSFFGRLNRCAAAALDSDNNLKEARQPFPLVTDRNWRSALDMLNRAGALKWSDSGDVEFPNAECARFCGGGWLEEYVWHIVSDARPHDSKWSVSGHWDTGARNELDVVAVHRNKFLLIECKTARFGHDHAADADVLYKLDSLGRSAGGLFGETWLVLGREPTEHLQERARLQRIRLIQPRDLPGLREVVRGWASDLH